MPSLHFFLEKMDTPIGVMLIITDDEGRLRAVDWLDEQDRMNQLNADHHPLMARMHKPDPKLPPDAQDKRMVVVLEPETWTDWLSAPAAQAKQLITVAPATVFKAAADTMHSSAKR